MKRYAVRAWQGLESFESGLNNLTAEGWTLDSWRTDSFNPFNIVAVFQCETASLRKAKKPSPHERIIAWMKKQPSGKRYSTREIQFGVRIRGCVVSATLRGLMAAGEVCCEIGKRGWTVWCLPGEIIKHDAESCSVCGILVNPELLDWRFRACSKQCIKKAKAMPPSHLSFDVAAFQESQV